MCGEYYIGKRIDSKCPKPKCRTDMHYIKAHITKRMFDQRRMKLLM